MLLDVHVREVGKERRRDLKTRILVRYSDTRDVVD